MAGGACEGHGLLLDISNPVNPVRLDAVADSNFAYWHSATFNNDGTKVLFTDEWGGGGRPRCRSFDRRDWGADAIYDIRDGRLVRKGAHARLILSVEMIGQAVSVEVDAADVRPY